MQNSNLVRGRHRLHHLFSGGLLDWLLPLAFFLTIILFYPFRQRFEFDPDEGSSAMMALLLMRGFPLYSQIWSDHPPLFIYLLAGAFRLFGLHIDVGRVLVLLLSTLFLWSAWCFLQRTWGILPALAGVALVSLLPYYISLSVSVMIGLPAIALAGLSMLALVAWHQQRWQGYLVISAILLALSVLTKIFTGFLAPIFIIGILLGEKSRGRIPQSWAGYLPAILWSGVFTLFSGGLGVALMGVKNLSPLITTHILAWRSQSYIVNPEVQSITYLMRPAWPILILALPGVVFIYRQRRWISLYPLSWAVMAYLLLIFQVPVWYHHQLLITLPAAMVGGIGVGESGRLFFEKVRHRSLNLATWIYAAILLGFIFVSAERARSIYLDFVLPADRIEPAAQPAARETVLLSQMAHYAPQVKWVVTDLPIFPFRLGLPTPPPLANISEKRLASGELSEAQIIAYIQEYRPEMVLVGRFKLLAVESAIRKDYKLIYTWGRKHLYLRRDLLKRP